ncbi:MAG: 2-isopropylmalate synthase [Candidatus Altiarchaeales archaeon]|nr:2-isopropylmalate synthase [Candidatus Altiarchaeales archaeon]MBD3415855.1 2-isopropylmalate synthase [Candidatus Altiarchaeales archaeon]
MARIWFLDTTLRDGEQTPGVTLTKEDKIRIAKALDNLGVDIIEAGSACTSEGEREAIKAVANEGLKAEVASYARLTKGDVDLALACDVDTVFLVAPTSDLHIKWKLNSTREKVLAGVSELTQYCKDHGANVDLCCEDGSRTDVDFLKQVMSTAVDAGADRFTVADTVGVLTPDETANMFKQLTRNAKVPVGIHCHDDFGMATANTVSAVKAGVRVVNVTVNGLGERAGNTPLEEVAVALRLHTGHKFNLRIEGLTKISNLVEKISGIPVPPNKAIVGDNAFTHEAGIHVDGILKKPSTYEPIKPEIVGARRKFVLGKHVGLKSVKKMLDESGFEMTDDQVKEVFNQVKYIGDKGKSVTSVDLDTIAHSVLGLKEEKPIKLVELVAQAGNRITPTATVKLQMNGDTVTTMGSGTGPVDAAINAIKAATKDVPFELKEYHVDSVSGGTDAVVRILVKLKSKGRLYTAEGAGADIVLASVDAMIQGLNAIIARDKLA